MHRESCTKQICQDMFQPYYICPKPDYLMQLNQFYRHMQRERERERQPSSETVNNCFMQLMVHAAPKRCVLVCYFVDPQMHYTEAKN
jgi:hypothetical protein